VTGRLPTAESGETKACKWFTICWDRLEHAHAGLENAHTGYTTAAIELGKATAAYDAARTELDRIRSTQPETAGPADPSDTAQGPDPSDDA
jgi:hypothetical protein